MHAVPPVHLVIMQPPGYIHSLGFLDQARHVRYQLRRLGAQVTLAKNRLREDAINIVFGAHLGFDLGWKARHTCLFFNLEQLGQNGAKLPPAYLALLRSSAVIDYDAANVAHYATDTDDVPIVPFGHSPFLNTEPAIALEDRPIDLLFFGSMNERRRAYIDRVERSGVSVATFDTPLYSEERDRFIRQAKAVLNCSYYETSRFEQARASHCLSLGTPVISQQRDAAAPGAAFAESVFWLPDAEVEGFFKREFKTPAFFETARRQLAAFATHDPIEAYADLLAFAIGADQGYRRSRTTDAWQPTRINLGSGKDYKACWLNLDVLDRAEPDLVLDLGQAVEWPVQAATRFGGTVRLEPGTIERVYANNVLEHVPDLPMLMTNVLDLLRDGGVFEIEVPYERALTAWQDPTHLRALNENSWLYYTGWFWYLGWFETRFDLAQMQYLDLQLKACTRENAAFMRVILKKIPTTLREQMTARAMQADFGGVADDLEWLAPEAPAETSVAQADVRVPSPAEAMA